MEKNWDSLHARLNSHYEAQSYQKKKHKKIKAYRKSVQEEPTVKRCLLILNLKPFRSWVKRKHSIGRECQSLAVQGKKTVDIDCYNTDPGSQATSYSSQGIILKKSASGSWMLPCLTIFFSKLYFDLKMPKMVFKQWYLSISNQTKSPFTILSAFFCSSGCCPMILDYSLAVTILLF